MADEKDATKKVADKPAAEKKAAAPKAATAKAATTKAAAPKAASAKATADKPAAEKKAPTKAAAAKADSTATSTEKPAAKAASKASAASTDAPREHVLKVHHLRPAAGSKKDRTRVGRGEGSKGKTAGRGTKGTKARYQVKPGFQGGQLPFHMRAPKLRGFKNPFRVEYQVVNLDKLSALYPNGGDVTVADLVAKGAVRKGQPVKVLGTGELTVKVSVAVDAYSASAKDAIVAAGGTVAQD